MTFPRGDNSSSKPPPLISASDKSKYFSTTSTFREKVSQLGQLVTVWYGVQWNLGSRDGTVAFFFYVSQTSRKVSLASSKLQHTNAALFFSLLSSSIKQHAVNVDRRPIIPGSSASCISQLGTYTHLAYHAIPLMKQPKMKFTFVSRTCVWTTTI